MIGVGKTLPMGSIPKAVTTIITHRVKKNPFVPAQRSSPTRRFSAVTGAASIPS